MKFILYWGNVLDNPIDSTCEALQDVYIKYHQLRNDRILVLAPKQILNRDQPGVVGLMRVGLDAFGCLNEALELILGKAGLLDIAE